jgi:hypothetical protein
MLAVLAFRNTMEGYLAVVVPLLLFVIALQISAVEIGLADNATDFDEEQIHGKGRKFPNSTSEITHKS